MSSKSQFFSRAKTRHDYSDQLMVRYEHPNGELFDTWVSGEEVVARLKTADMQARLEGLRHLKLAHLQQLKDELPETGRKLIEDKGINLLASYMSDTIGGNVIGDSLVTALTGRDPTADRAPGKEQWLARLKDESFRLVTLELAWIQIGDTLPPEESGPASYDDWV